LSNEITSKENKFEDLQEKENSFENCNYYSRPFFGVGYIFYT